MFPVISNGQITLAGVPTFRTNNSIDDQRWFVHYDWSRGEPSTISITQCRVFSASSRRDCCLRVQSYHDTSYSSTGLNSNGPHSGEATFLAQTSSLYRADLTWIRLAYESSCTLFAVRRDLVWEALVNTRRLLVAKFIYISAVGQSVTQICVPE